MKVKEFFSSGSVDINAIARYFDGLSQEERITAVRSLGKPEQQALWNAAKGRAATVDEFVPPDFAPGREVRHFGKNTLPLHTLFEKRFCRPTQKTGRNELWGYNFQSLAWFTGPGYYVAYDDPATGELCIDYNLTPPAKPDGWPDLAHSSKGISALIYGFMVDRMRRVSRHVTIGRAWKHGKETGNYFLLCQDENPA
ncbi:MAG: hypothetical protein GMKNLPBB_03150 [Myxococcota bacterium]|nr:hypothetical protein [Myxococcota bacterium]